MECADNTNKLADTGCTHTHMQTHTQTHIQCTYIYNTYICSWFRELILLVCGMSKDCRRWCNWMSKISQIFRLQQQFLQLWRIFSNQSAVFLLTSKSSKLVRCTKTIHFAAKHLGKRHVKLTSLTGSLSTENTTWLFTCQLSLCEIWRNHSLCANSAVYLCASKYDTETRVNLTSKQKLAVKSKSSFFR